MSTPENEDDRAGARSEGAAQTTPGGEQAQQGQNAPSLPGYAEPQGDDDASEQDDHTAVPPSDSPPEAGEPVAAQAQSQGATGSAAQEPASPPSQEPSHRAEGIGVIDTDADVPRQAGTSTDAEAQASSDHFGQDEGRDTLTVGEAQRAMSGEQEQRLPAMSQNNASEVEKVSGIVAQTRQDVGTHPRDEILHVLRQRLEQTGINLPDDEVEELVDQITVGD